MTVVSVVSVSWDYIAATAGIRTFPMINSGRRTVSKLGVHTQLIRDAKEGADCAA